MPAHSSQQVCTAELFLDKEINFAALHSENLVLIAKDTDTKTETEP